MNKTKASNALPPQKRMALYARVSTQEQTKGQYPSCESQIEELEAHCKAKGWHVEAVIKDEAVSAGSLKRPGLSRLRSLVEDEQIDGVVCTWYDRMTRSRDFYVLDKEFKTHNVSFITLHDPTDRHTASGRFMETLLVAAKTYEREQTGEKVHTKMQMRAEKGLWNGGYVPFGFRREDPTHVILPNEKMTSLVQQLFQVYVETRSDFAVRDWLRARQIPAPNGNPVWSVGTLRDLLSSRRYIGEIEINKQNEDRSEVPESEAYRIVKAPHGEIVPRELWELAQSLRQEKAEANPNNPSVVRSRGRSYAWSKDQRVYPLQGLLSCAICGSLMTPHYVFHKAGKGRRNDSFINHYVCTKHRKYGTSCDHRNRVLARVPEAWVLERVEDLAQTPLMLERALAHAIQKSEEASHPAQEALARTRSGLAETEKQIDILMNTLALGTVTPALMQLVNERAHQLKVQRETLRADQRRLLSRIAPTENKPDAQALRTVLADFTIVTRGAEPVQLQRMLRLMVRRITWNPEGCHSIQLHKLPNRLPDLREEFKKERMETQKEMSNPLAPEGADRFDISRWSDGPDRIRTGDLLRDRQACWASTPRVQIVTATTE